VRFGPGLWPGPRRQARWVARGSAQGWVLKVLSAQRLERTFGCPCGWRGRPGQCAAFRPGACDFPGVCATRSRPTPGPRGGRGTGQIRRVPHAAGHRGSRARQLGAPQGFRPKGATKAATPPTARPRSDPGRLWRDTLAAHHSPDWPRPFPRDSRPCPSGVAHRRCALETVEKLVTGPRT
jgi:hypothetical protein